MKSDNVTGAGSGPDYTRALRRMMLVEAPSLVTRTLGSPVNFARFTSQSRERRIVTSTLADDYFLVLALIDNPARPIRYDGRHLLLPRMRAGQFVLQDKTIGKDCDMELYFDNIHVQFPKSVMESFAVEMGAPAASPLRIHYPAAVDDPVVTHLGQALLPAFERPNQANKLFLDSMASALLAHLAAVYGNVRPPAPLVPGGLTPRQLHRAQDMMLARLDGEVSLATLAQACGLSRPHFARAFKRSAGMPPHRWLIHQRIKRSKALLLHSDGTLAGIADECGFADQSHFARTFSASVGISPREWRRRRRS